jgi:hypothetical protein
MVKARWERRWVVPNADAWVVLGSMIEEKEMVILRGASGDMIRCCMHIYHPEIRESGKLITILHMNRSAIPGDHTNLPLQ